MFKNINIFLFICIKISFFSFSIFIPNIYNMAKELTNRSENYSQWYNDLVVKADLAENSAVRGCMVIKPYGYAIWEKMQAQLDKMFKETGHVNAYFPLFIPKSFFSKEASHVEGFAKECAVVTHYRLKNDPNGKGIIVDENAKLEEELIVRPTSETIIWNTYKNWIQSYRDLPILCNQWANVVRWEMRTRLFLRTAEFLWQEGHTAHATKEEAIEEAEKMIRVYADFAENFLALPVIMGAKSANERFAGAIETYTIEALMQDGKALQSGTSHFLGQNFAKAFDVTFTSKEGTLDYVWATSWGVSTRLMGALIMAHSDDNGLVLPPKLAPIQVVIVPIYKGEEQLTEISKTAISIKKNLESLGISVKYDNRDTQKPGWKFAEYELKGVPVRIAIGPRDIEQGTVEIARRDTLTKETLPIEGIEYTIQQLLETIQNSIYKKAFDFRESNTIEVQTYEEFKNAISKQIGFVSAHWDGTTETEEKIKQETKATIRCIPFNAKQEEGTCIYSGKPSKQRVLFAIAY
ncbi:MAG: Proline--tRNA ligase [Bacteroidetes bacterium ADurb.Bin217]|nr:MAG: Proline--tRNA ligase [Bacteroidetes bacterium ADurb.Bin217]